MNNSKVLKKSKISVKAQVLATLIALISAVALPQIFHLMGALSGLGTSLGETFLPMHLPILFAGLVAGPYVGAAAGLLSPAVSHLLTGMPGEAMLPFMMIELCVYGLVCGLLRNVKLPTVAKVLAAQVAGRAVRALALVIAVFGFGSPISLTTIWMSIVTGLFGLALQWVLLPLLVYRVEGILKDER
ncbi:MAG: ECF transporter S component [Clostridia bacterium]|nr:ECF transporter S component [Clostridia bacterium]